MSVIATSAASPCHRSASGLRAVGSPPDLTRAILHVDLDCFFVSVERVLDPSLAQVPVVVGGSADSRGVVCSASREARAHGVHAGMPTATAQRLAPDAVFLPGRGRLYARASAAAFKIFREFSFDVERASIDEAYLDVTESVTEGRTPFDIAAELQLALEERLGLPSSVGIATNKLVAKVACQKAKPAGIMEVWPGYEETFVAPMPASDLPGVGPVLAERLKLFGLSTVGDVARVSPNVLEATFGRVGLRLAEKARGKGRDMLSAAEEPKTIGHERTFARDVRSTTRLIEEIYGLSRKVAHRLRRHGLKGRTVTLKVRTGDFRTYTRSRTLRLATDLESELAGMACFLLHEVHSEGLAVRLLGVSVGKLGDEPAQGELFPAPIPTAPEAAGPARAAATGWRSLLPFRLTSGPSRSA